MRINMISPRSSPVFFSSNNMANSTNANFQTPAQARAAAPSLGNPSTGVSSALGAQTVSTLLQLQAQEADQAHGHGMKMPFGLEAEEMFEDEEAAALRRRRKLAGTPTAEDIKKAVESDQNGDPVQSAEQSGKRAHPGKRQTL